MKNFIFLTFLLAFLSPFIHAQDLKLMTYNIRLDNPSDGENAWIKRKSYLCAQLLFYKPDIFGIQEALPNQVLDIAKALPQYNYIGTGRDEGGKGEASNIFFNKNRFEIITENTFWLSETPDRISKGWDAALNRVCTYALFKDKKSKQLFWVFNTHLDHQGETAKTNGIEVILTKIKQFNPKNHPVFLMGDFNSEPFENRIVQLKNQMQDSYDGSIEKPFGPIGTFNGFKHNEPVLRRIDYIFLSPKSFFKVRKYAVLSDSKDLKYPSDHLPVFIELDYN
jgi:endonuclease/exonuclease/phosphatase family metal-dependent hydrolase